jgi:cobalt-zinc-cadmium efflux system membrane fusion protein
MRWAALAAIVPIAACVIWLRGQRRDFAAQQVAEASTLPADVVVVDAKQMQQITVEPVETKQISLDWDTTGRITFDEDHLTPVAPPYAGRVQELLAGKGDRVLKDQPMVKLESPDLVAVQADLTAVRSDVAKAKIGLGIAQSVAERIRDLSAHKAAATKDLQQAEADLARAQDEERRAEATLATVESRLELFGKQPQEIERPGAPVDRSIVIRAPISGTVVDRKIGPGQYIRPDAAEPLFLISDLTTLWVQADVFESDLALIHLQAPVEIIVEAYPDLKIPARISYISPVVDPTTRTVRVRGLLKNETGRFKPDMFARIRIVGAAAQSFPLVPAAAVITEGNSSVVFVEEGPARFRRRQIQVKREMQGHVAVASGLQPGERIATRGSLLLNEVLK